MPIDWHPHLFQQLPSTQDFAHDLAAEGAAEGTLVQAMTQDSGRGRHGNQWQAPVGNLYMSFILRPQCTLNEAGQLSFICALAVADALEKYIDPARHKVQVKWPNDVFVDGLKICGILLESNMKKDALESLIVGIGVNIFNKPQLAICLNDVAKDPVYVNKTRDNILDCFSRWYETWVQHGFAPVREAWLEKAYGLDKTITARLPDISYEGRFESVTENGAMVLRMKNGAERVITAAEIHFGEEGA
jgi:BirA family biotin operon repressor/biotin-[acetyl-CoA-carboxylase] ligase